VYAFGCALNVDPFQHGLPFEEAEAAERAAAAARAAAENEMDAAGSVIRRRY
jgi:hypothetical protein